MEIVYRENALTAWQVQQFQQKMGWTVEPLEQWQRAIQNSCCTVAAYDGGELVAMGRLLGDGALYWYLNDVFVLTAYQGQGIGRQVVTGCWSISRGRACRGPRSPWPCSAPRAKKVFTKRWGSKKGPAQRRGTEWNRRCASGDGAMPKIGAG